MIQQEFFREREREESRLEITPRDLEIIKFVTEMKFASFQNLYELFFRKEEGKTTSGMESWARKRLLKLVKNGFLSSEHSFSEAKKYYLGTRKSHKLLSQLYPEENYRFPALKIDHSVFTHDKVLVEFRALLQNSSLVSSWISERQLFESDTETFGNHRDLVPDAIVTLRNGFRLAIEVEIARKEKSRYQKKISSYLRQMRQEVTKAPFDKCLFICLKPRVKNTLEDLTRISPLYFSVTNKESFLSAVLKELEAN